MGRRSRTPGFSLIEVLVVVVIVAIVTSIALLSVGLLADDRELQTEARRVMSLLELARDEAIMQGRELGVEVTSRAYRFVEYDPLTGRWNELIGDDVLRLRELPEESEFALFLEDKRVSLPPEPKALEQNDEGTSTGPGENFAPHLLIFSSGDVTPFELHLIRPRNDQLVVVAGDITGALEIVDEDG